MTRPPTVSPPGPAARCGIERAKYNPHARVATGESRAERRRCPLIVAQPDNRPHPPVPRAGPQRRTRRMRPVPPPAGPSRHASTLPPPASTGCSPPCCRRCSSCSPLPRAQGDEPAPHGRGLAPATRGRPWPGLRPARARWGAGHRGVDLAGPPGQPVRAALPGRSRSPARSPAAASWWWTTGRPARPTSRWPPWSPSVTVVPAGAMLGRLAGLRVALLPALVPALGPDRGPRALPRPAHPGGRRAGAAAPARGALPGLLAGVPAAVGHRRRARSGARGAAALVRPAGAPDGRPAAAGRW